MTSNLLAALKSNQGKTTAAVVNPLIEAAKQGSVEKCQAALLEPKVKLDQKDTEGMTALMHAAIQGCIPMVQFLVEKGARISSKDDGGETALMKACKEGNKDIMKFLLSAQLAQKKRGGPLGGGGDLQKLMAAEKRRVLDAKDDEGVTAVMKASEQGEADIMKDLLEEGATLEMKDDEGWNVLMWAALAGHNEIVETLVNHYEVAAEYTTEKGENALMKASANGHWEVCDFLLEKKAKVNQVDTENQTALMWAAAEGHLLTVKGLINKDAKIDLVTKAGKTALLLAAQFGRDEVCKFLISNGAKVDHQDAEGHTALFGAVQAGNHMLCETLIAKKCPLEARTTSFQTALMWGALHQQLQCVQVLISTGAQIHSVDENGKKAVDHAEATLNSHVVEELREAAKRQPVPDDH